MSHSILYLSGCKTHSRPQRATVAMRNQQANSTWHGAPPRQYATESGFPILNIRGTEREGRYHGDSSPSTLNPFLRSLILFDFSNVQR